MNKMSGPTWYDTIFTHIVWLCGHPDCQRGLLLLSECLEAGQQRHAHRAGHTLAGAGGVRRALAWT